MGRISQELVVEVEARKTERTHGFKGIAYGSFDGVLKVVDLRGDIRRAVLILTAGGKQIECTVNALTVDALKTALDSRVVVYGRAHYGGSSGLPDRLDVTSASPVHAPQGAHLTRWRGAFNIPESDPIKDWE